MGKVTMRDIGRLMGVSAVTVSKALSGKSGVSEELRQRIVQAASELGYVNPNAAPTGPSRGLDVGILVPDRFFSPDSYYAMLYKELIQALTDAGHFGILEILTDDAETNLTLPHLVRSRPPDALILLGQPGKDYRRMISRQRIPVIFLDFFDPELNVTAVVGDNVFGAARMTESLIAEGHQEIGFVGDVRATSSIMERYLGFVSAMTAHGLHIQPEWVLNERNHQGTFVHLSFPDHLPTAFVCNCDSVAAWVIDRLKEQGLRVPEDISVTGFDDFLPSVVNAPSLTTFRIDHLAMIKTVVRLVTEICAGHEAIPGRIVIGGQPILRDSVRTLLH